MDSESEVFRGSPGYCPGRKRRDLDLDSDRVSVDPSEDVWSNLAEGAFKLDVGRVWGAAKGVEYLPFASAVVLRLAATECTAARGFVGEMGGV